MVLSSLFSRYSFLIWVTLHLLCDFFFKFWGLFRALFLRKIFAGYCYAEDSPSFFLLYYEVTGLFFLGFVVELFWICVQCVEGFFSCYFPWRSVLLSTLWCSWRFVAIFLICSCCCILSFLFLLAFLLSDACNLETFHLHFAAHSFISTLLFLSLHLYSFSLCSVDFSYSFLFALLLFSFSLHSSFFCG